MILIFILARMQRILVIIPAYNADGSIPALLNAIESLDRDLPVLVVDDGSRDRTCEVARAGGAECVRLGINQGKGTALRAGFEYLVEHEYAAALTIDADLQHDAAEIPNFIRAWQQAPGLVIGVRKRDRRMPYHRRLSNHLVSWVTSLLAGHGFIDAQCGFRLIPADLLRSLSLVGKRYEMEEELLIKAGRLRYPVTEIEVRTIYNSGRSFIRPISDTFRFLKMAFESLFW